MTIPMYSSWHRFLAACITIICMWALSACQEELVQPAYYGTITGTVLDARTNLPLANVSITTNPATSSYVTSAQGKFQIDNVPAGRIAVTAVKPDYPQVVANVTVSDGQSADVSILLAKSSVSAPIAPVRVSPANQATNQPIDLVLTWRKSTSAASDSLRYDAVLFESNSITPRTLLTNSRDTTVLAAGLKYNTTYYWQVTVRNSSGTSAKTDTWSFQTRALPVNRYLYARTTNGNTDVYSSNATGGDLLRLTTASSVETSPQLSPNGDLIAYSSNATGQFQLYTMNRDGSNARRITTLSIEGYSNSGVGYRWSPDGAQLIYAHYDQLYRINRDGTGLTLLATAPAGRHFRQCDWTAQNGGRLVVQTIGSAPFDSELYLYNVDGSSPLLLVGNLPGRLDSPSFSLDARSVLYTRDVLGYNDPMGRQLDSHIFIQRLDGSSTVDLSTFLNATTSKAPGTNDLFPSYTPDGFHLIFVNAANDDQSPPDVYTMDLDGRNRVRLFQNATLPDFK